MKRFSQWFPVILVIFCATWIGAKARLPRDPAGQMKLNAFGRLPVVYQGRIKPLDTLARNGLVIISDRQTYRDEAGKKQPAIRWLLDTITRSDAGLKHKVFRIEHLQLLDALGLERRKGYRYALEEFQDKISVVEAQANEARQLEPARRGVYENKVLELVNNLNTYFLLTEAHGSPEIRQDEEHLQEDLRRAIAHYQMLERFPLPHAVPPSHEGEEWQPFMRAVLTSMVSEHRNPAVTRLATMFHAYKHEDVERFNTAVVEYQQWLRDNPPSGISESKLKFEAFFNNFSPFYHCSVLYAVAFLLSCCAWVGWARPLNRAAFWLMAMTFVIHTFALFARIQISGYPPVTNLYSSAIFIGWGAVILGLVIEVIYRLGVGNLVASVFGFLTLLIAHFLAGDGDTMEMMQAVLDTKFWLATHVTTVTLGYTATFFAGGLAILYILRGVLTRSLDKATEKMLGQTIYGVVCFALLLSFIGTVLGGLWADDSWGRFWGWDPKENGALIIVLWNGLILHARWGGMVKTRGIAVLAVLGNIMTAWSWFGVNQLGVGLHSYGFVDSVAFWLVVFVASQLAIAGTGMLPRAWWRSFRFAAQTPTKAGKGKRMSSSPAPGLA